MKGIRHIFFDLDHTLWDYDFNARKVLAEVYTNFQLDQITSRTREQFLDIFFKTNQGLWHQYNIGEIDREFIRSQRFTRILEACEASSTFLSSQLSEYFLFHCPRQTTLIDDAVMVLDYLSKKYEISIITNGFEDVQRIKLKSSGLDRYFQYVFTSESIGAKKPDPKIFFYALEQVGRTDVETLMIGDNPHTDILGAQNAGITPIFYNPGGKSRSDCPIEIRQLSELLRLL